MTGADGGAGWDDFAEDFERHAEAGSYNALYDRPAVLDLVGDVDGLRILDAGCGPGFYAAELVVRLGGSYFTTEQLDEVWNDGWHVHFWRQPLGRTCDEFAAAGFLIERLVEPLPDPAMATRFPDDHAKLVQEPGFVAFRLVKPPFRRRLPARVDEDRQDHRGDDRQDERPPHDPDP